MAEYQRFVTLKSENTALNRSRSDSSKKRRYVAGINNLINIYADIVDYWSAFDNSRNPRMLIATGGKDSGIVIANEVLYQKLKQYVKF